MPERIVGFGCALLCLAASACAIASHVSGTPPLFSQKSGLHMFDFEQDALHQPPEGFDPRVGRWTVEDSPTAASGTQVLVRGGEEAGALAVKNAEDVDAAAAEAATRIFLGGSGAGLECSGKAPAAGYVVKIEPNVGRIALYRKSGDTLEILDQAQVAAQKGEWARIGIRCDGDRVVGYFNGKAVVKQRADIHGFELALYADPGVTAQFDDVTFWVPTSR